MIEIKDLLLKFNNLLISETLKIDAIRKVLLDIIKIEVEPKDIKIKNNIIYLSIKPIYKNEIFLKKDKIFLELKNILGKKTPQDIK